MALPSVRSYTFTQEGVSGTTLNLAFPAIIEAGDIIVAAVYGRGDADFTVPSGFTFQFQSTVIGVTDQQISVFTKVATGSEVGNVSFTSIDTGRKDAFIYSVQDCSGIDDIIDTAATTTQSVVMNPTSTEVTIYITHCEVGMGTVTFSPFDEIFGSVSVGTIRAASCLNTDADTTTTTMTAAPNTMQTVAISLSQVGVEVTSARRVISINYLFI